MEVKELNLCFLKEAKAGLFLWTNAPLSLCAPSERAVERKGKVITEFAENETETTHPGRNCIGEVTDGVEN